MPVVVPVIGTEQVPGLVKVKISEAPELGVMVTVKFPAPSVPVAILKYSRSLYSILVAAEPSMKVTATGLPPKVAVTV